MARLQLLQSGHAGKVKRLVVHPTRPWLFLSLSADGSVRMWHAGTHLQLQVRAPLATLRQTDCISSLLGM